MFVIPSPLFPQIASRSSGPTGAKAGSLSFSIDAAVGTTMSIVLTSCAARNAFSASIFFETIVSS